MMHKHVEIRHVRSERLPNFKRHIRRRVNSHETSRGYLRPVAILLGSHRDRRVTLTSGSVIILFGQTVKRRGIRGAALLLYAISQMACLNTLKQEIKTLESVFPKSHERFQIVSASVDELNCRFVGKNGKNYEIHANITVSKIAACSKRESTRVCRF